MVATGYIVYPRKRDDSSQIWYYKTKNRTKTWSNGRSTGIKVSFDEKGSPTSNSRETAEEWVERRIDHGDLPLSSARIVTFGDFAKNFWAPDSEYVVAQREFGRRLTESHRYNRQRQTERHLLPQWKKHRLDEITTPMVKSWLLAYKRDGYYVTRKNGKRVHRLLTGATMNDIRDAFSQVMDYAVSEGLINRNPVKPIPRFRNETKERGVLSIAELRSLLDESTIGTVWPDEKFWLATYVAAGTGLRMSEVRVLQPQYIGDGFIHVAHGWDQRAKALKLPKWDKTRTTPAPMKVIAALRSWIQRNAIPPDGWVFPGRSFRDLAGWSADPISDNRLRTVFYDAVEKIGIDRTARNIVFHSLRHSIVLASRTSGVDPWQMMKAVGHGDLKMLDHYSDHAVEAAQLAGVVDFQNRLFADVAEMDEIPKSSLTKNA